MKLASFLFVTFVVAIAFASLLPAATYPPDNSDIIPSDRRIDWTLAGIPGGIPARTTVFADVTQPPYSADNTGTSDASAAINKALADCRPNEVVYLPAGKYRLTSQINFATKSDRTLRGAGPATVLLAEMRSLSAINLGVNESFQPPVEVTSAAKKGSTECTVADAGRFAVGSAIQFLRGNDPELVFRIDRSGKPMKYGRLTGQEIAQISIVTAKDDNKITFAPPLMFDFDIAPKARPIAYVVHRSGVEDLKLTYSTATTSTPAFGIFIQQADRCWIKNVESEKVLAKHFWAERSVQTTIKGCYVHESLRGYGPNAGTGIDFYQFNSYGLIEDNAIKMAFPSIMLENSTSGTVVAYNYSHDAPNVELIPGDLNTNHGPHNVMNLWEGNVGSQFQADGYHGSSSHTTLFRNRFHGTHPALKLNSKCVDLCIHEYYFNVIGNVLGFPDYPGVYAMSGQAGYGTPAIYRLGYPNMANNAYGTAAPDFLDPKVEATLLRHGNWDFFHQKALWDPGIAAKTLPDSLYLSGKPAWFGDLAWPSFGPDGGTASHKIPAQVRLERMP